VYTTINQMLSLPKEISLKIIYSIYNGDKSDGRNLYNFMFTCKQLHSFARSNWQNILEYYTVIHTEYEVYNGNISDTRTTFTFCGQHHKTDGPAFISDIISPKFHRIYSDWYQYGKLHRGDDKPAVDREDYKAWYQYGKQHRDNDQPAFIAGNNELRIWFQNDKLHRARNRPAIIRDGYCEWWVHGRRYRSNGRPVTVDYHTGEVTYGKREKICITPFSILPSRAQY
jgi:hypothetical protein